MQQSSKSLFFGIIGLAILIVAGMFAARFFLVSSNPVVLSVLYSTEKDAWLQEVIGEFEGTVNGRPIEIEFKQMGSREMYLSVLDGAEQPDLISPASMLQISLMQDLSTRKFGQPVVKAADSTLCRSVVSTPLVLVAWRERAEALWGDNPNSHMWQHLHEALVEKEDWEQYGHPEWGYIKFGHTNPETSNSGLMTILLMTYGYFDKRSGLTSADILSDDYGRWFTDLEGTISEFGNSTGTYMLDMVTYGPSKYDIVAVYESIAIEQAENALGRYGELRIYYPPATVLSDHPFCIIKADWVSSEKAQAGEVFIDYLLTKSVQEKALAYGFRPADSTIPLDQAGSPFTSYSDIGIRLELPPQVEVPPGDVLDTLLNFWSRSVRR